MQLTGELIQLRALEPHDLESLYKWENDPTIWSVSGTLAPFSKFTLEEYLQTVHQDIYTTKQLRLMLDLNYIDETTDELEGRRSIGCIDLFEFDPKNKKVGIGILIANRNDRGKGYATEALHLCTEYAFNVLDVHQVYANVRVDNESSLALFKKLNFEVTGLKQDWIYDHGRFYDEYTMQLIRK
jgi:diamine N-acetyltransferase